MPKQGTQENLYLLSALDVTDRLDIVLMEIRHIQQTIIYLLHTPTLYLPQRYEEKYIFGEWECLRENFQNQSFTPGRGVDTKLANLSIIRYPSPSSAIKLNLNIDTNNHPYENSAEKTSGNKTEHQLIVQQLKERLSKIWTGDVWARGQRRHYHALRALQILKSQVFRDKLTIYRELQCSGLVSKADKNNQITHPAIMVLLDAVKSRIAETYIKILCTHQQNLSKSLSYGLQDFPRPLIDRRRNIGIFADFLSERTHDIQKDMLHLIDYINPNLRINQTSPLILHGWSPLPYTGNIHLFDDVGRRTEGQYDEKVEDVNYVDSSFWSPDRPDLQPLIAYEAGKSLVCHVLKDLNDDYISNTNDDLSRLISAFFHQINDFTRDIPELQPIQLSIRSFLKKLISDLLAASIKGIAYVYAIFLSVVGRKLGKLLVHQSSIRLDRIRELQTGIASISEYYEWYFRLKLCAFWMKHVMHIKPSTLDNIILNGVDLVCDDIVDFLDKNTPPTRSRVGKKWKKLECELENIMVSSPLVMKVREWRTERSLDTWNESKECPGKKEFYRSTIRLDLELQNYLFREIFNSKKSRFAKEDMPTQEDDAKTFEQRYGLKPEKILIPKRKNKRLEQPKWMFRHLYDIPFQCATMRSIDIIENRNNSNNTKLWNNFIHSTHEDLSLGRELFALALEFYTWGRESPRSRLLLCVNLVAFSLNEIGCKTLKVDLTRWLNGQQDNNDSLRLLFQEVGLDESEHSQSELVEILGHESHDKVYELFKKGINNDIYLKCIGATNTIDGFSNVINIFGSKERRLEQISGYKLRELNEILIAARKNFILPISYYNILEYLKIHSKPGKKGDSACASSRFYKVLLSSLGDDYDFESSSNQDLEKTHLPKKPPFLMVSRLTMTNYYPTANTHEPTTFFDRKKAEDNEKWNPNGLTLKDSIELRSWDAYQSISKARNKFFPTLNQYDAIGFIQVKLPCKCRIPAFEKEIDLKRPSEAEKFVTHFSIREVAIPVKIHPRQSTDSFLDDDVLTVISISLQRRSMRLNLLFRLLTVFDEKAKEQYDEWKHSDMENKLAELYDEFKDKINICGLLTDGWGDVLLVFSHNNDQHPDVNTFVDMIFDLQETLYEDFMVDRTEITFMPKCIDGIIYDQKYSILVDLRFMEDRRLEKSISKYIKAYNTAREDEKHSHYEILSNTDLLKTPGRMDFSIRFKAFDEDDKENHDFPDGFHATIIEILSSFKHDLNKWFPDALSMLSKIETTIEQTPKMKEPKIDLRLPRQ